MTEPQPRSVTVSAGKVFLWAAAVVILLAAFGVSFGTVNMLFLSLGLLFSGWALG